MKTVNHVPEHLHTLTTNLVVRDCAKAIDFYKRALGAQELSRVTSPIDKSIWHAELKIEDSVFFANDEMPGMSRPAPSAKDPAPVTMFLYVRDTDAAYRKAIAAGATSRMEPADMFWGDRMAEVVDPHGYQWAFLTRQKDMTSEDLRRAAEEMARSARRAS